MKIAKVLSTCFKRGRIREKTELVGDPPGYFSHSQNFTSEKDVIKLLNYQIEMEKKFPPGLDRDLIIVNSDVNSIEGNLFVKNLDQKKINDGKVITFNRKNVGLSYGAYSDAFLKFRNDYDFFLFIEDDVVTIKKDYLKIAHNKWKQTDNCGFVALIGLSKVDAGWWQKAGLNETNAFSAYSGCGFTSKNILNKIVNNFGSLPHNTKNIDHKDSIAYGEIGLSKSIIDLGYKLTELKNEVIVVPAYDSMRSIKYKKYPNFYEKYSWLLKSNIYSFISKSHFFMKYYIVLLKILKNLSNK
tara:strand:+ start:759 stop:1655 length:897 start_codon:yes stop_codon:yes gene_type:complete